jgi:hypothetical protein
MKKLNLILIIAIVFSLALLGSQIYAQQGQGGGGQQGGGQQFQQRQPPTSEQMAQMAARRIQTIMERLKLSDSDPESVVIKQQIEALTKLRTEQGQKSRTQMDALQKALDAKPISKTDLSKALKEYKKARAEQKADYEKAETEFLGILTAEQEANLTLMGIVNGDGGGAMMFGGFRPGGPGQDQGGQQRQRNQQGQGNQRQQGNQPGVQQN